MDELIAFLRRCLDEDERVALAVQAKGWDYSSFVEHDNDATTLVASIDIGDRTFLGDYGTEDLRPSELAHIARWDPARVLAEVEAKRQMLDFLDPTDAPEGEGKYVAERAIVLLAQPYAGQPGWREEWRI